MKRKISTFWKVVIMIMILIIFALLSPGVKLFSQNFIEKKSEDKVMVKQGTSEDSIFIYQGNAYKHVSPKLIESFKKLQTISMIVVILLIFFCFLLVLVLRYRKPQRYRFEGIIICCIVEISVVVFLWDMGFSSISIGIISIISFLLFVWVLFIFRGKRKV